MQNWCGGSGRGLNIAPDRIIEELEDTMPDRQNGKLHSKHRATVQGPRQCPVKIGNGPVDNIHTVKPRTVIPESVNAVRGVDDPVRRREVTWVEPRGVKHRIIVAHVNIVAGNSIRLRKFMV